MWTEPVGNAAKRVSPMHVFGRPDDLYARLKLPPTMLMRIGGLAVLATNVEYHTEQALWAVEGHAPKGVRHPLDGKPGTRIREALAAAGRTAANPDLASIIKGWCAAAEPLFKCRNNIFHGVSVSLDGTWATFINGPLWAGEKRAKTESFSADDETLSQMEDAFGMLFRGIVWIEKTAREGTNAGQPSVVQALTRGLNHARSVGWELHAVAAAVNHEKY